MKLYIVGSVGSGKSTLARRISKLTGIPSHNLDEVVYEQDPTDLWGNRKRPVEERDMLFSNILTSKHYIMEDGGREYFIEGMRQTDVVVILDIPLVVRKKRILLRWIKQNLRFEKCIYKPRFDVLKSMFKWAQNYETGADGTKARIAQFHMKTVVLKNNKDIEAYIRSISKVSI